MPILTVIVATRNRADLLPRALDSIAKQTLADFECLICDDGSSEDTLTAYRELMERLGPRFVLCEESPANAPGTGPGTARNRGLRRARGEFVTFLDDDDWFTEPNHFEVAVQSLRDAGADFFFSNRQGMRGTTVVIPDWYPGASELTRKRGLVRENPDIFEVSLRDYCSAMQRHFVHPGNVVLTRALALADGGGAPPGSAAACSMCGVAASCW